MPEYWSATPEWAGQTAFIICGGPSLRGFDFGLLWGRKVIAVNSSFEAVPFADFLIFADSRWWETNKNRLGGWQGRIVCLSMSPRDPQLLRMRRKIPPAEGQGPDCLALQFTTTTAAMDLAAKLGAIRVVLLGLDGKFAPDGTTHHHKPHPWRQTPDWTRKHRGDLAKMVEPMKKRGVEVVLGTPSAYSDLWPCIEVVSLLDANRAAA